MEEIIRQELVKRQTELALNDEQFAEWLGVSRATWSMFRSKKLSFINSPVLLKGVIKAFPTMADKVAQCLFTAE